jgi:hypothetical protein
MKFEIERRYSNEILFTAEVGSLKLCVEAAVKARADLAGANLARANLAGADLAGANLAGANLAGANLAGANLADANLAGANLARANLAGANLARANLAGADLAGANLAGANLAGANLARANLAGANLARANLAGANLAGADLAGAKLARADLAGANGIATPEESDAMLAQIAAIVLSKPERLRMEGWHGPGWDATHTPEEEHSCGTAHCLAGWAQALCPLPLVRRMDPVQAGCMLIPTAAHMFYNSNDEALEFLKGKLAEKGARGG